MAVSKGVTLIEMIVAIVIMGTVTVIAIPKLISSSEQSKASGAENNLYAISGAQQRFNEDWGSYCISTGVNPTGLTAKCGDTVADLNINLRLSITDNFTYICTAAPAPYQCQAADGTDTLTLTPNPAVVTCAGPAGYCTIQ